ncbi:MAG: helix-turn-helix domain-containing protein [Clostridia bacterium]|nr:helix-turn-helix domain-containing protein [Clostridia bacterium]
MKNRENAIFYKYINNDINGEFRAVSVGRERCSPAKKKIGPVLRNRFTVQLITSGKGYFEAGGKSYVLGENDVMFIPANQVISYYPDNKDPWVYYWFEYVGQNAIRINERAGFSAENPVYHTNLTKELSQIMEKMCAVDDERTDDLITVSLIYEFFSLIIKERISQKPHSQSSRDETIKNILFYINDNYNHPSLSLKELSEIFNFNASYLSRLFKQCVSMPFVQYLTALRMQKAGNLLQRDDASIKSIALSVGYRDPLYFTREFRRYYEVTPTQYRKEMRNKN